MRKNIKALIFIVFSGWIFFYILFHTSKPWLIISIDEGYYVKNSVFINICGTRFIAEKAVYFSNDQCEGTVHLESQKGERLSQGLYITPSAPTFVNFTFDINNKPTFKYKSIFPLKANEP